MNSQDLPESLNALLADHLVLVMKLHNYHWHIRGGRFRAVHQLTESYYDYFFKSYDDVAERILQIGGTPLVTLKSSLQSARLQEEAAVCFTENEVLENIRIDFDALRISTLSAIAIAGRAGDSITEGLLLGFAAWLDKELWMLRFTLEDEPALAAVA